MVTARTPFREFTVERSLAICSARPSSSAGGVQVAGGTLPVTGAAATVCEARNVVSRTAGSPYSSARLGGRALRVAPGGAPGCYASGCAVP